MASVSPNITTSMELTASAGPKKGETLLLPAIKQRPLPQTVDKDFECLELEPCSTAVTTRRLRKKGGVRIRLARFGRKNAPVYRIHVANSRSPRDGSFLEKIGFYDPGAGKNRQKRIAVNFERAKYWLSVGAQPTDTVKWILSLAGLLPGTPVTQMTRRANLPTVTDSGHPSTVLDEEEDDCDEEESADAKKSLISL